MLTPKQVLKRLTITLTQVKAGNTSENLLDQEKQIAKKVNSNILNLIKL